MDRCQQDDIVATCTTANTAEIGAFTIETDSGDIFTVNAVPEGVVDVTLNDVYRVAGVEKVQHS